MANKFKYLCMACNTSFNYSAQPKFCPNCGGQDIQRDHGKAALRAREGIAKCRSLLPEVEARYQYFMEVYVEYEDTMQMLRVYKKRGVISAADLPSVFRPKLADSLKAHRLAKREEAARVEKEEQ